MKTRILFGRIAVAMIMILPILHGCKSTREVQKSTVETHITDESSGAMSVDTESASKINSEVNFDEFTHQTTEVTETIDTVIRVGLPVPYQSDSVDIPVKKTKKSKSTTYQTSKKQELKTETSVSATKSDSSGHSKSSMDSQEKQVRKKVERPGWIPTLVFVIPLIVLVSFLLIMWMRKKL